MTGGDPIVGAITGGVGGFAPAIGQGISAIAPGLDPSIVTGLSGGVTGALGQTLAGGDPLTGFATGAIGSMLAPTVKQGVQDMTQRASTVVNNQMQAMSGNMKPQPTVPDYEISNMMSDQFGPTTSMDYDSTDFGRMVDVTTPSPIAVDYNQPYFQQQYGDFAAKLPDTVSDLDLGGLQPESAAPINPMVAQTEVGPDITDMTKTDFYTEGQQGEGIFAGIRNMIPESIAELLPESTAGQLLLGGALASTLLGGLGEADQLAIQQAESSGIFDRPINNFDFVKIRTEANKRGMSMSDFLNSSFFLSDQSSYYTPTNAARGGIMDAPGYVSGPGNGRDDVINARLSDGEYVIDAESVSMLGDGSNAAGAKMLDDMRKKLRMHKGKVLAKGRFSPDAKSPFEYMRRSA